MERLERYRIFSMVNDAVHKAVLHYHKQLTVSQIELPDLDLEFYAKIRDQPGGTLAIRATNDLHNEIFKKLKTVVCYRAPAAPGSARAARERELRDERLARVRDAPAHGILVDSSHRFFEYETGSPAPDYLPPAVAGARPQRACRSLVSRVSYYPPHRDETIQRAIDFINLGDASNFTAPVSTEEEERADAQRCMDSDFEADPPASPPPPRRLLRRPTHIYREAAVSPMMVALEQARTVAAIRRPDAYALMPDHDAAAAALWQATEATWDGARAPPQEPLLAQQLALLEPLGQALVNLGAHAPQVVAAYLVDIRHGGGAVGGGRAAYDALCVHARASYRQLIADMWRVMQSDWWRASGVPPLAVAPPPEEAPPAPPPAPAAAAAAALPVVTINLPGTPAHHVERAGDLPASFTNRARMKRQREERAATAAIVADAHARAAQLAARQAAAARHSAAATEAAQQDAELAAGSSAASLNRQRRKARRVLGDASRSGASTPTAAPAAAQPQQRVLGEVPQHAPATAVPTPATRCEFCPPALRTAPAALTLQSPPEQDARPRPPGAVGYTSVAPPANMADLLVQHLQRQHELHLQRVQLQQQLHDVIAAFPPQPMQPRLDTVIGYHPVLGLTSFAGGPPPLPFVDHENPVLARQHMFNPMRRGIAASLASIAGGGRDRLPASELLDMHRENLRQQELLGQLFRIPESSHPNYRGPPPAEQEIVGASRGDIEKYSTSKQWPAEPQEEELNASTCTVCLNEFAGGEDVRCLPCKHSFHVRCIDPWLVQNKRCPNCRELLDQADAGTVAATAVTATTSSPAAAAVAAPTAFELQQARDAAEIVAALIPPLVGSYSPDNAEQ